MSISFDRAATYYDQTRAMPPDVADKVTQSIIDIAHATRDSRLLEIGIGTGRIAFPLIERGYEITGVDLSRAMMEQMVRKVDLTPALSLGRRGSGVKLAQADMARLPFADESFDAAYAVHVLHLSPAWRDAVGDARRVLKNGAPFMASWHHREIESPNRILRDKLTEFASARGVNNKRPGAAGNDEIREELEKWGTRVEWIEVVEWQEPTTVVTILDQIDRQIFSDTWLIPRPVLDELMPHLREFARSEFGDPARQVVEPASFTWIVARK